MSISCVIVEDEPNAVKLIEKYIRQVPFLQLKAVCRDGQEALSFLSKEKIDLVFMDINLPVIGGMKLTRLLSSQNIIFTTAYSKFAAESYETNAVDYLVKPFSFERFYKAVMKAKQINEYLQTPSPAKEFAQDILFIKTGKKIMAVSYSDILYVEGSKEYAILKTVSGNHLLYKRMKELENKLPGNFARVHNSFIINLAAIMKIEDNHIFIGDKRIPLSDKYKESFSEKIRRRLL